MDSQLGQYKYWRPDRIGTAYIQAFRRNEARIWRKWKDAHQDEYEGLLRLAKDQVGEELALQFDRLMAQADTLPDDQAVTRREEAFALKNREIDYDACALEVWREEYSQELDSQLVDAILDAILTPRGHSVPPHIARLGATDEEVAQVTTFFYLSIASRYRPQMQSDANGQSSTEPGEATGKDSGQSSQPTPSPTNTLNDLSSGKSPAEILFENVSS